MKLVGKIHQVFFFIGLCFSMAGCVQNPAPVMTTLPTPQERLISVPTGTAASNLKAGDDSVSAIPPSGCSQGLLETAVRALQTADSFRMTSQEVISYRADFENGESQTVYGEFITTYEIRSSPQIKVRASHEYRYSPAASFDSYETYYFEQEGVYYEQRTENGDSLGPEEIRREEIEPFAGDIFQTLTAYYPGAVCASLEEAEAVYVLQHPAWYTLNRGIGFADLGMLKMQEDGDSLIKRYVEDHYSEVKPIRFLIYVARDSGYITKVVVDDREFMASVWEAVDQALHESGGSTSELPSYHILEDHRMEYAFGAYERIADFEIP